MDFLWENKIPYLFMFWATEGSRGKETQEFLICDGKISFYKLTKFWIPTLRSMEFPFAATVSFSGSAGIYHSRLNLVQSSTTATLALLLETITWAPKWYLQPLLHRSKPSETHAVTCHLHCVYIDWAFPCNTACASVCTYIYFKAICAMYFKANPLRHFEASNQVVSSLL